MDILYIILILTFVAFNVIMSIVFKKIFPSLSDMYYSLPEKWRKPFWFILFSFWALATMIISGSGFMVGAGFGIALVGTAPAFRVEPGQPTTQEKIVHVIGAITSAIWSQMYILVELRLPLATVASLLAASIIFVSIRRGRTYWMEMVCFAAAFYALRYVI